LIINNPWRQNGILPTVKTIAEITPTGTRQSLCAINKKMKRLSIILFVLMTICSFGQTPAFKWVKRIPFVIASQSADNDDNIFIAGEINDTTVFDNNTLYVQNGNIVVAKIDSSGSLLWFRQFGAYGIENSYDGLVNIAVDHNNDLIVVNYFDYSTIYYGDTITASGHGAVIIKLSKNGDLIWYEVPGYNDSGCFHALSLAIDQDNNIFISGDLQWGGNAIFTDTIIPTNGSFMDFRAKYNSDGNFQWARASDDIDDQITCDYSNNIIVFSDTVQKFSGDNTLLWEKPSNGSFTSNVNGWPRVAADSLDDLYIFAHYNEPFYIGNDTLTPPDSSKFIFIKLNSSGEPILEKIARTSKGISSVSISVINNKIGVLGGFRDKLFIESDSLISITNKYYNSFIVLYDLAGNLKFIKKIDGKKGCKSQLISVSKSIYVSGTFSDTIYFDNLSMIYNNQYTSGCFLTRLQYEVLHTYTGTEHMDLYPNPALESLTISINPMYLNATLEIYDTRGQLIYRNYFDTYIKSINIEHLSKGIYFVKVTTTEKTFINKFEKV